MIGQLVLTFREALEAALIISIILAYLSRTRRSALGRFVWMGVYLSIGVSLVLGALVGVFYGTLTKQVQVLFEGGAALLAVVVLTTMIYWMATKGRKIRAEIEEKVEKIATTGEAIGNTTVRSS